MDLIQAPAKFQCICAALPSLFYWVSSTRLGAQR